MINECGPYDLLFANWAGCGNSNLLFAYDKGTGQLIAVIDYVVSDAGVALQACAAGPSSVESLTACGDWTWCVGDGGLTDGGVSD